jgi:hypothetical protein
MERLDGWEGRLAAVLKGARTRPYVLGTHDCFRVACAAVQALTGVDHWPDWAGRYSTRREALRLIAAYGGTFTGAYSRLFGSEPVAMSFAQRGDIAEYIDPTGEAHLGVMNGASVLVLGADGLFGVGLFDCRHAWRIG